ncbi:hypothetical protein [Hydrogenophaga sp. 2FB]|uniref:hypothetical protein n=1 Tax=Hydrogenophaga sp. 2FB TaxID=2502187 RepID=UPI0010F6EBD4|nr:hypothetical protein [Hydrogenophaga sp. 2FB]
MAHHACVSTVNAEDGSLSRIVRVLAPASGTTHGALVQPQLQSAAEVISMYESRDLATDTVFRDRHWHIDAALMPFDPRNVQSGLKIFDDQCNRSGGFMRGNVSSNTQFSTFIRPRSQTHCNGFNFGLGDLRKSDLKYFTEARGWQPGLADFLKIINSPENADKTLVGYQVFHTQAKKDENGRSVRKIHGWVVTDHLGALVGTVVPEGFVNTTRSVMDRAVAAFSNDFIGETIPLIRIDGGDLNFIAKEVQEYRISQAQIRVEAAPAVPTKSRTRPH